MRYKSILVVVALLLLAAACTQQKSSDRVVFDLIPNLEDADLLTETRSIPGSAMQVLRSGRASASFYSFSSAGKRMIVRCKASNAQSELVLVPILNGHRLKPRKITASFEEYSYPLKANLLDGWNEIQFLVRSGDDSDGEKNVIFDSIAFGRQGDQSPNHSTFDKNAEGITAPVQSKIQTYFKVPKGAVLETRFGLNSDLSSRGSAAEFRITIEEPNQQKENLASETLTRTFFSTPSSSFTSSLAPFEDKIVRISFETWPVSGKREPEKISWESIKLALPKAQSKPEPEQSQISFKKKPNIFLYLIDALRGDHLQTYGYPKQTSPRIQEFSRSAVVFENAYAQSSWTRASVASIVTGLYPSVHLTIDRIDVLDQSLPTLQRFLKANGYFNYGIVAQPNVSGIFHFEKNFDDYKLIKKMRDRYGHSAQLVEQFRRTLEIFNLPAFVYLHAIDTHRPYAPLPQFTNAFGDCRAQTYESEEAQNVECARLVYESLILQSDYYFGLFIDLLKQQKLFDDSIIIVTADHGEAFMEHGVFGHGKSLYEHDIRVPLIIHFPENRFAGKRVADIARHIDLLPTFLEILSIKKPAGLEGASLLPLLEDRTRKQNPVFSELGLDGQHAQTVILEPYKLIATLQEDDTTRYELYHLANDPAESKNLTETEPVIYGYMKRVLKDWSKAQKKKAASRKSEKAVLDKETEEMLKGLGYLQ